MYWIVAWHRYECPKPNTNWEKHLGSGFQPHDTVCKSRELDITVNHQLRTGLMGYEATVDFRLVFKILICLFPYSENGILLVEVTTARRKTWLPCILSIPFPLSHISHIRNEGKQKEKKVPYVVVNLVPRVSSPEKKRDPGTRLRSGLYG